MKPEPETVTGVAADPAVADEGVTDATDGVGLLLSSGGGVVVEPPPPPPQPVMDSRLHKINAITAHFERGMGRPVPDILVVPSVPSLLRKSITAVVYQAST